MTRGLKKAIMLGLSSNMLRPSLAFHRTTSSFVSFGGPRRLLRSSAPRFKRGSGRQSTKEPKEASVYKDSVRLPVTEFNLRANAVQREPEIQAFWKKENIYELLKEESVSGQFVLHDGPPYANGDLHIGHALNKILKDFINRFQMLQGKRVEFVPGWDLCPHLKSSQRPLNNRNANYLGHLAYCLPGGTATASP
jgi:hypothetical protein